MHNRKKNSIKAFSELKKSATYAKKIGLEVHAGHGLNYKTTKSVKRIGEISEFNIGHFLVSESLFVGLNNSIKKFKDILRK